MSCQNYSELFIHTFIQTLAQLSAIIVSGSLAVPVYNYYIHNRSQTVLVKEPERKDTHTSDTSSDFTDDTLSMENLNDQQFRIDNDIINH